MTEEAEPPLVALFPAVLLPVVLPDAPLAVAPLAPATPEAPGGVAPAAPEAAPDAPPPEASEPEELPEAPPVEVAEDAPAPPPWLASVCARKWLDKAHAIRATATTPAMTNGISRWAFAFSCLTSWNCSSFF